jgi:sulfur carrier protein
MLAIELNGEVREVRAEDCIQDLIDALSLTNQALAIAVNRQVVPRVQWRERRFLAQAGIQSTLLMHKEF